MVACPLEHACETVADSAASCVSYVHRTSRVGRNEFDEDPFALAELGLTVVVLFGENVPYDVREPLSAEEEIDKSRSGNFGVVEDSAFEIELFADEFGDLSRRELESLCAHHSGVCCEISVGFVGGYLDYESRKRYSRNGFLSDELSESVHYHIIELSGRLFDEV